jgi:hypothetical protein
MFAMRSPEATVLAEMCVTLGLAPQNTLEQTQHLIERFALDSLARAEKSERDVALYATTNNILRNEIVNRARIESMAVATARLWRRRFVLVLLASVVSCVAIAAIAASCLLHSMVT